MAGPHFPESITLTTAHDPLNGEPATFSVVDHEDGTFDLHIGPEGSAALRLNGLSTGELRTIAAFLEGFALVRDLKGS